VYTPASVVSCWVELSGSPQLDQLAKTDGRHLEIQESQYLHNCFIWSLDLPMERGKLFGGMVRHNVTWRMGVGHAKTAEPIELPFWLVSGVDLWKFCIRWVCTLAPLDKYGWTIVRDGYEWVCHQGWCDTAYFLITLGHLVHDSVDIDHNSLSSAIDFETCMVTVFDYS